MTQHQRVRVHPVKAKKSLVGNYELSGKYFRPGLANSTDGGIHYRLIQETEDFIMAMCGCPDCTGVDVLEEERAKVTQLEEGIPRIMEASYQFRHQRDRLAGLLREAIPGLQHLSDTAQDLETFTLVERVRTALRETGV